MTPDNERSRWKLLKLHMELFTFNYLVNLCVIIFYKCWVGRFWSLPTVFFSLSNCSRRLSGSFFFSYPVSNVFTNLLASNIRKGCMSLFLSRTGLVIIN